jgi:hypothetical protein
MATIKEQPGSFTAITMSLQGLASGSWWQSNFVDNSSNLYVDAFVQLKAKTGATAAGSVDLWAYASMDAGTSYSDGATGADGTFTPTATPNIVHVGTLNTPSATTSYISAHLSIALAFGGTVPQRWGIAAKNTNGGSLDATGTNFVLQYQGFTFQAA